MEMQIEIPDHVSAASVFDFDIYADARISSDLQGSYAEALRDAPDFFWTPRNGGHWVARRYDIINEIVLDFSSFSNRELHIPRSPDRTVLIPLNLDPPANMPYRKALLPHFSGKAVKDMEDKIRGRAIELIEEVVDRGECDFSYDIASRFPVSVFMDLMGMPLDRLREFRAIADQYFDANNAEEYEKADPMIRAVMSELIALRRREPGDDLVSRLLATDVDGRRLDDDEMLSICILLFLGGMDTVTNLTGFTFQTFARDPALQDRLAADPSLIPQFIEEALRMFGVVSPPRLVAKDCERFGVTLRAGDMVSCLLMMAGRDETKNADPNRFDLDRKTRHHLTFGSGPHLCLGHYLARAELKALTEEWLKRIPRFELVPGAEHKFRMGSINAMTSLPLRWSPAG